MHAYGRGGKTVDHADLEQGSENNARVGEYIVFCNQPYGEAADGYWGEEGELFDDEQGGEYESFWHEADVLLLAVAGEVERGELTPAEARELLKPYREVLSLIYTGEQRMIYDPRREWWSRPESFPGRDEVRRNRPASAIFWYEADGPRHTRRGSHHLGHAPPVLRGAGRRGTADAKGSSGRQVQGCGEGGPLQVPSRRCWMGARNYPAGSGRIGRERAARINRKKLVDVTARGSGRPVLHRRRARDGKRRTCTH